jgi:uncharacterized OB-fold protein
MSISDEELVARFPDTRIDPDNKHFYAGWLEQRLLMNRCGDCGRWHHPPRPLCPQCWSFNVKAEPVKGSGTVHLLINLHQGIPAPGVDYKQPHPVVSVELDEQPGLRYSSTVIDCPLEKVRIGMRVELAWVERFGAPYPVFKPVVGEL